MRLLSVVVLLAACGGSPAPVEAPSPAPAVAAAPAPTAKNAELTEDHAEAATQAPAPTPDADGWTSYGAAFTMAEDAGVACKDLLTDPGAHAGAAVRVSGRVADVCQAKGCWMVLTPETADSAEQMIRVTMLDHAFSVDKQGAGGLAQLEGVLKAVEVDAETIEHYAGEGGDKAAVPEKHGAKWELVASSVRMKRVAPGEEKTAVQ